MHTRHHGHGHHGGAGFALLAFIPGYRFFLMLMALIVMCGGT